MDERLRGDLQEGQARGGARGDAGLEFANGMPPEGDTFVRRSARAMSAMPGSGVTIANPAMAHNGHR